MSGPTVATIATNPIAVLIAAAVLAARAVQAGYDTAAAVREQRQAASAERADEAATARLEGQRDSEQAAAEAEGRFDNLVALAAQAGIADAVRDARPQRPADPLALPAYTEGLQALSDRLQQILLTAIGRRQQDIDLPAGIALPAASAQTGPEHRLLARLEHLGPPPPDIAALAREIEATPPGERHELLLTELRHRIQRHLEAAELRQVQQATAIVVEETLKDLGYQVEAIGETLFVDGGIAHFRRPGWGDHMVRLRVDPGAGTVNLNVIRAVDTGNNERSVLDHLAEDRWCAEFPALLAALEARGVHLDVTRRLQAGELPVQLVDRTKLPRFADEEETAPRGQPLAREIK